jgi:ubiquitin-like protein Pup
MKIKPTLAREPDHGRLLGIARAADQGQTKKGQDKASGKSRDKQEAKDLSEKGKKLKEDMDELVDEIDEVLEENAEEFVKNYIQRGGE